MLSPKELDNIYTGKSGFVIGGGPSLKPYLNNEKVITFLQSNITIGCNRAYEFLTPSYTVVGDPWFSVFYREQLEQLTCPLFLPDSTRKLQKKDVYYLQRQSTAKPYVPLSFSQPISFTNNCGVLATRIAHLFGCNQLYLLGMDLHTTPEGTHYHSGYPQPDRNASESRYRQFTEIFITTIKEMQEHGRIIISCSPTSPLNEIIPYEPLEELVYRLG